MSRTFRHIFALAVLLLSTLSCFREVRETVPGEGSRTVIRVTLKLPGAPRTYALSEIDENRIDKLDVMVFRVGGDDREYFYGSASVAPADIVTDDTDPSGRTKVCTVEIPFINGARHRLVFIANAASEVAAAPVSNDKDEYLSGITFSTDGNWPSTSSAFIPFPMWGESGYVTLVKDAINNLTGALSMMRAVARVDVKVNESLQADFELHEAYLYNRIEKGLVVPSPAVVSKEGGLHVTDVTVPGSLIPRTYPKSGEKYTTDDTNHKTITRSIYLLENPLTLNHTEATCFVLGGKYLGGPIKYWRVDLPPTGKSSFKEGFRTFLRNNAYEISVDKVTGDGYDTPDDAFEKSWTEIKVSVKEWVNGEPIEVEDSYRWHLTANPASFRYLLAGTAGTPGEFKIWTDYFIDDTDQGWTGQWYYADGDDGSWLHLSASEFSGPADETKTYTFTVDENNTGKDRHAYMKVYAGNMVKYVDIFQSNQVWAGGSNTLYDWAESDQSENNFDGPYRLGVSTSHIDITRTAATTVSFTVTTDYPGGYTTFLSDSSWMSIDEGESSSGPVTGQTVTISATGNPLSEHRDCYIDFIAGNLTKRVKIVQFDDLRGPVDLVMSWTESEHSPENYDGPYRLGVQYTHYELNKNARSGITCLVATNHPGGYAADVISGADWITLTDNTSSTESWPDGKALTFSVAENLGASERQGIIRVVADNMEKYIYVRQNLIADVSVESPVTAWIEDGEGTLAGGGYYFHVQYKAFSLSKNANPRLEFTVNTDDPKGYTVKVVEGDTWLHVFENASSASPTGSPVTVAFSVSENYENAPRVGKICVISGNIRKFITVTQSNIADTDGSTTNFAWTEDGRQVLIAGGYSLDVQYARFDLSKNVHPALSFTVATDNPGGYKASVDPGVSWISITANPEAAPVWPNKATLSFSVEENNTAAPREGRIIVRAGSIVKYVRVVQSNISDVDGASSVAAWTRDGENTPFAGGYGLTLSKQNFLCSGETASFQTNITAEASTSGVQWRASTPDTWITLLNTSGAANGTATTLAFDIAENTGTADRIGTITLSLVHGGNRITHKIRITQRPLSQAQIVITKNPVYVLDPDVSQSFKVTALLDWAVRIVSDPSGIVRTLYGTGGSASDTPTDVFFALKEFTLATPPASGTSPYTVNLEIYSPVGQFHPIPFTLEAKLKDE